MFRNPDHAYAVLMDQLQDAYDDDLRLRSLGKINPKTCHEMTVGQDRIEMLIKQIAAMLQPSYVNDTRR